MGKILLVEDSSSMCMLIQSALEDCHSLTTKHTLRDAHELAKHESFDLLLIDLTLPDGDGFDLCKQVLSLPKKNHPIVIFISSRYDIDDKLTGFALGAEDYIVKPFHPQELKARVEARLQKKTNPNGTTSKELSDSSGIVVDLGGLKGYFRGENGQTDLNLTPNEFKLLRIFLSNPNTSLSRGELLNAGWGNNIHVLDRTIDRHISALRKKLGKASHHIEAIPGHGYRWKISS